MSGPWGGRPRETLEVADSDLGNAGTGKLGPWRSKTRTCDLHFQSQDGLRQGAVSYFFIAAVCAFIGMFALMPALLAAVEFAKAAAMRPQIVVVALENIGEDPELLPAMVDVLEAQMILEGDADITLLPRHQELIGQFIAAEEEAASPGRPKPVPKPPPLAGN